MAYLAGRQLMCLIGVAMTFGIYEEALTHTQIVRGSSSATGVIGTTMNGVMYLSMPVLATMLNSEPWIGRRRVVALAGTCITAAGFFASSYSTQVWHLILLQGVIAAFGAALLYSPTTLVLAERYRSGNRATAYAVQLSSKNAVGTVSPFIVYALLDKIGFRGTLRIWAGIVLTTGTLGVWLIPKPMGVQARRPRKVPWDFLKHRTFWIYATANMVFSSGYGLPQTYLGTYASDELHVAGMWPVIVIAMFNVPGIISCIGFGLLNDKSSLSAASNTLISALGSALCVFIFWGFKSHQIVALLVTFSVGYGFFAGGFSSTWGGWIQELEREAAFHNEAVDPEILYGLMNGARGIGYVVGGLAGVQLLKAGALQQSQAFAYGTKYGALILFTGISAAFGGWAVIWKASRCGISRRRV